ncbi:hypothetical protein Trydic_g5884 [Trypoxylus dichotomus]
MTLRGNAIRSQQQLETLVEEMSVTEYNSGWNKNAFNRTELKQLTFKHNNQLLSLKIHPGRYLFPISFAIVLRGGVLFPLAPPYSDESSWTVENSKAPGKDIGLFEGRREEIPSKAAPQYETVE